MFRAPRAVACFVCLVASAVAGACGGSVPSTASSPTAIAAPAVNGSSNALVKSQDVFENVLPCKLPRTPPGVGLGFPNNLVRLKAKGTVRIPVIFVDFADAASTETPQQVYGLVYPTSAAYLHEMSHGALNVSFEPSFQWLRMSKPSTGYGWANLTFALHQAYIQEAVNLAVAASVDFSQADGLVILANPAAAALRNGPAFTPESASSGVNAGGRVITNAVTSGADLRGWAGYWAAHEMGHNLGLPDLYHSTQPAHRSVGMFGLMGLISGPAREFFAFERWGLGWLDDSQVVCADNGETIATLTPIEQRGGTKMLVVPVSATAAVVVESRRLMGFDAGFTPGALVYFVDTAVRTQQGPIRVLPIDDADSRKGSAPLTAGNSLTYGGVTVTVLSSDAEGDVVQVVK